MIAFGIRLSMQRQKKKSLIIIEQTFTGCNDGLDNPTCGQMLVNEEPISFSQVRVT